MRAACAAVVDCRWRDARCPGAPSGADHPGTTRFACARSPICNAAPKLRNAASALSSLAACTTASGSPRDTRLPMPRTSLKAHARVDGVAGARASAAERDHRQADGARVHRRHHAVARARQRPLHRCARQSRAAAPEHVARPAERGHHAREAFGRLAAVEHLLAPAAGHRPGWRQDRLAAATAPPAPASPRAGAARARGR